jgi:hypothetical protein
LDVALRDFSSPRLPVDVALQDSSESINRIDDQL